MKSLIVVAVPIIQGIPAALSHDTIELIWVDQAITIAIRLLDHFLQLVIGQAFTKLLRDPLQISEGNFPSLILVEQGEDLVNFCPRIFVRHPPSHHLFEFVEVDGLCGILADICKHALHIFLLHFESKCTECCLEFPSIDSPSVLGVEQLESLPQLLHLLLVQTGPPRLSATSGTRTAGCASQDSPKAAATTTGQATSQPPARQASAPKCPVRVGTLGCECHGRR
mmetsp:Transcript_89210/g.186437  ORF Transcript_89210/g.186437 Transcript_89210/m.186437 type:complete len:225 (-) Transcript_89210:209-883(-)